MEKRLYGLDDIGELSPEKIFEMHREYLNSGFTNLIRMMNCDKVFREARGSIIKDSNGNEYIDFLGGYGSLNLGHSHPYVVESLGRLMDKPNLVHTGLNPYPAVLAANLANVTGGILTRSFFCNSGTEAVEGALKLARAATGRKRIIYCKDSFHGKTFGALSVAGREKYKKLFEPLLPDCEEVDYGDAPSLEEKLRTEEAAAFIVEAIQGEGGVIIPPEGYLGQVRKLCTQYDTLLIMDEVQTGLGRTGRMFAYEHEGITPDVLCLAKSLGGGVMPIGAYITTDAVYQKAYGGIGECLLHTSTFGGNTYACAAAIAAIEVLCSENMPQKAEEKGKYIMGKLKPMKDKYNVIKEIRGRGLLIGIEFNAKSGENSDRPGAGAGSMANEYHAAYVAGRLLNEYNILTAYSTNNPGIIRLEPPLGVTANQIDLLIGAIDSTLKDIECN